MELLLCPFCGSKACIIEISEWRWAVGCNNKGEKECRVEPEVEGRTKEEVVEIWNDQVNRSTPM